MRTAILTLLALAPVCAPLKSLGTIPGDIYFTPPTSIVGAGSFEFGESADWRWVGPQGYYTVYTFTAWPGAADGVCFEGVPDYIYEDLQTVPGQAYELRYYMAGDIRTPGLASMDTLWGGNVVATGTWSTTGNTSDNLGWIYTDIDVVATSSVTRLLFQNEAIFGNPFNGINPAIDAVSVVAIPEPGSVPFFFIAIGLLAVGRMSWASARKPSRK